MKKVQTDLLGRKTEPFVMCATGQFAMLWQTNHLGVIKTDLLGVKYGYHVFMECQPMTMG